MSMMYSGLFVLALMTFVIVVGGGVMLAVRIMGAREVRDDHPH
jgi:hypothetical protein